MDLGIAGRRAAVAAASGGLGLGAARALAADGVDVAICGRDADRLAAAVDELQSLGGGTVHGLAGDVSTIDGAEAFVRDATEALGGIDILVPNAGGPPAGGFATTALSAYAPALELSLLSGVAMCQAAVPAMRERGWGRVVAITSVSVRQPIPGLILSNTARAGLTGFLKTLALEVAADGVTVNTVQPGSHATDRLRSIHGGDLTAAAAGVPTGELGRPEDFGAVVAFLCSDQARFITGAAVPVDGGSSRALQ
ncbi:MAG: SDR family oxidoreductase [Acidimicrobiales bacterium]